MCIMFKRFRIAKCFSLIGFCLAGGFRAGFSFRTNQKLLAQTHFVDSNDLNLHEH